MIYFRGIEYLELVSDSIMPEMFGLFSSEWDDEKTEGICSSLVSVLDGGGAVLGAYVSDEDDTADGDPDNDGGDFVSIVIETDDDEPEEKPYDWYIEDEEDQPECRSVVGICAVCSDLFSIPSDISSDTDTDRYIGMPILCVAPGYRRRGIGKGLFRRCVRLARSLDARRLYIPALSDGGDTQAFFSALGCSRLNTSCTPSGNAYGQYPLFDSHKSMSPFEYPLYPKSADGSGMLSIEEYQTMAGTIIDSLPKEFFYQLNGGVVVRPEKKTHAQSVPGVPMYVMGEYTRSSMMGRMIYLYYGSFAAIYGRFSRAEQRELLRGIIVHEFRHHMEWLSGTRELEDEDERGLRAYLSRFAGKKNNNNKNKKDGA